MADIEATKPTEVVDVVAEPVAATEAPTATETATETPAVAEPVAEPVVEPAAATEPVATTATETVDSEVKSEEKPANGDATEPQTTTTAAAATSTTTTTAPNNNKFDPSSLEETDDPVKIRNQVEFYFGDFNFPTDKFMWEQSGGSENKPIELNKICSFKRMRRFQPYSAVVNALKDSKLLDISGAEGQEVVKRKNPYVAESNRKNAQEAASVYVKGFGEEAATTQLDLETFFAQFGAVQGVRLRRGNDNSFKGSVFVQFQNEETATKFLALDPQPKYNDTELKIMSKKAYCEEKTELIRQGKMEPGPVNRQKKFFEGREIGGARGGGHRGGHRGGKDFKGNRNNDQRRGGGGHRGGHRGGRHNGHRGGRRDNNGTSEKKTEAPRDPAAEALAAAASTNKRSRDEDAGSEQPPAKKVATETAA